MHLGAEKRRSGTTPSSTTGPATSAQAPPAEQPGVSPGASDGKAAATHPGAAKAQIARVMPSDGHGSRHQAVS
jgi:hypothetical protein